jgi:hypothetical protein
MAYRVFTLPVRDPGAAETELNGFLASHRVLSVDQRFVEDGERSFWTFGGFPGGGQCPIHNSHVIRSTHWARHAGGSNGSAKYCVSRTTLPAWNSMMLTVLMGRPS